MSRFTLSDTAVTSMAQEPSPNSIKALALISATTLLALAGCMPNTDNSPSSRASRLAAAAVCNALRSPGVDRHNISSRIKNHILSEDPMLAQSKSWDESTLITGNHIAATRACPELFPDDSPWKRKDFWNYRLDGTPRS